MSQLPYMPLWVDAYESDTKHLNDQEHGRYFALLRLMWKAPECQIPNDDKWLARKLSRSEEQIKADVRPIIEEFCTCTKNFISQKRLRQEWESARSKREKARDSAKARWDKEKRQCDGIAAPHSGGNASIPKAIPRTKNIYSSLRSEEKKAFDEYWEVVPNKHDIDDAADAFKSALDQGHKPELIIKGAKHYADESKGREKAKLPWPAQWLRARSWEDWLSAFDRDPQALDRARIGVWLDDRRWRKEWGPDPMSQNCPISRELIEQVCKDKRVANPFSQNGHAAA